MTSSFHATSTVPCGAAPTSLALVGHLQLPELHLGEEVGELLVLLPGLGGVDAEDAADDQDAEDEDAASGDTHSDGDGCHGEAVSGVRQCAHWVVEVLPHHHLQQKSLEHSPHASCMPTKS